MFEDPRLKQTIRLIYFRPFFDRPGFKALSMNRLAEFIQQHPYSAALVVALAVAAIVIELRHRKEGATALGPMDAVRLINGGALVVDVRNAESFAAGHIIDSRHIQSGDLPTQADSLKKYREKPVLFYCDTGIQSSAAARTMKALGFGKAVNLRGGLAAWKKENLPTVTGAKGATKSKGGKS